MNLQEYKVLFLVVTGVSALFVASPALQRLLVYPQTEFFTEMWLLGPGHMAEDFPFNITRIQTYDVFLGVANHLGQCAYYVVEVKFRNETQSAPDSFNRTASTLPAIYNITAFVADKETWELPLSFSFDYIYDENSSQVDFNHLTFNNVELGLGGYSTLWNKTSTDFFGKLFFELWIHNDTTGDFQYHERYVDLRLNMTV